MVDCGKQKKTVNMVNKHILPFSPRNLTFVCQKVMQVKSTKQKEAWVYSVLILTLHMNAKQFVTSNTE